MIRRIPSMFLLLLASCAVQEPRAFSGLRDQGHGPGIELCFVFVGDRVQSGTFSLVAPDGLEDMGEPRRLDYPVLDLVQNGMDACFRVDLQVASGIQPFFFDARFAPQGDGTIHVHLHQRDSVDRPVAYTGPPIVLERVETK